MAKKQHEKTTRSPLKTPGNQKTAKSSNLTLDSSDDEAPDEVTFEESRSQALGSLREAQDTAQREKELLKEKRRKRHELFQEQKRKKLLPADVLEEIDGEPSQEQKPAEVEADKTQWNKNKMEKLRKVKKNKKITHVRHLRGNNKVSTLKAGLRESLQQQAAEDFIRSRLYGPGSCRTTNNELLSLQNKTGKNKSAAVRFVKKDWAPEKKAQAEKLNRRWIHTRQSPAS